MSSIKRLFHIFSKKKSSQVANNSTPIGNITTTEPTTMSKLPNNMTDDEKMFLDLQEQVRTLSFTKQIPETSPPSVTEEMVTYKIIEYFDIYI